METIGHEVPPIEVVRLGDARIADWEVAAAIRRRLEQLAQHKGDDG